MRFIHLIVKYLVGGLFIFSGLIKINDPIGTAIKLEEYFEVFSKDLAVFFVIFTPYSLELAVFIVVLEVVLGLALLVDWRKTDVLYALLALILFFTFLTFYSAYFNKVTDCGCFGDAIKLTPWGSFQKDIVLLVLVLVLIATNSSKNQIKLGNTLVMLTGTVLSFFLAWYALEHLPFIDFRSYKIGANLPELMTPPKAEEPCIYRYFFEKDGKQEVFEKMPNDFKEKGLKFVKMEKLNAEKCSPLAKITDFALSTPSGNDTTQAVFEGTWLIYIFQKGKEISEKNLDKLLVLAEQSDVNQIIATSDNGTEFDKKTEALRKRGLSVVYLDEKVAKTIMRSNPGVFLIRNGIVLGKWHHNDTPKWDEIKYMSL
jgi:uncharacterized membrane protein YphA (DoxX/SURF4 family)